MLAARRSSRARAAGVPARAELVHGRADEALVALAEEDGAQHDRRRLLRRAAAKGALIVGSTAHKLLHLSERPVLVVRAVTP